MLEVTVYLRLMRASDGFVTLIANSACRLPLVRMGTGNPTRDAGLVRCKDICRDGLEALTREGGRNDDCTGADDERIGAVDRRSSLGNGRGDDDDDDPFGSGGDVSFAAGGCTSTATGVTGLSSSTLLGLEVVSVTDSSDSNLTPRPSSCGESCACCCCIRCSNRAISCCSSSWLRNVLHG